MHLEVRFDRKSGNFDRKLKKFDRKLQKFDRKPCNFDRKKRYFDRNRRKFDRNPPPEEENGLNKGANREIMQIPGEKAEIRTKKGNFASGNSI
ncbi:hypothetical protein [Cytobacillus gottheilii]|uniref:hypothetical protein n=1 Tax=Cytobacillus gottheilii TaxID=859144 RepID=UPI003464BFEC